MDSLGFFIRIWSVGGGGNPPKNSGGRGGLMGGAGGGFVVRNSKLLQKYVPFHRQKVFFKVL